MRETLRYGIILASICIVAAGLLASVHALTKSRIIAQAQTEEKRSLKEVLPAAEAFKPIKNEEEVLYYKAYGKQGKLLGVAFRVPAKGYSGTIETMVGMLGDGTISAIKILNQNETPGLGARISEPKFTQQFRNKKDLNSVQAISGATISSRAVLESVRKRTEEIKKILQNEKPFNR